MKLLAASKEREKSLTTEVLFVTCVFMASPTLLSVLEASVRIVDRVLQ